MICLFCKRILRLVSIDVIIVFDLEVLSENTKNIFNMVLSTIITSVLWSHYTKFIFTFSLINNYLLEKKRDSGWNPRHYNGGFSQRSQY